MFIKDFILQHHGYLFLLLAFIINAIMDTIKFHFSTSIFSKIKNKKINDWLNPNNYINMYKNGNPETGVEAFWGSSRWFAPLVDGWHFFKMLFILSIILILTSNFNNDIIVISNKSLNLGLITFLFYCCYGLIFQFLYGWLFVKNKQ